MPHLAAVARFAQALTQDATAAEDLVQDTFLIAAEQWGSFTPGTECRAWLFTICRHRFFRVRKREQRQEPTDDPILETLAAVRGQDEARAQGLAGAFEQKAVLEAVHEAIARLPDAYREVAVLVDLNDQTYETTAGILGVPVGTVRSRLFRARRLLQEQLLDHARDLGIGESARTDQGRTD